MGSTIRRVNYFYTSVEDRPGQAYKLLSQLTNLKLNLLAFTAIPVGPTHTQLTLFPEDVAQMAEAAEQEGLVLDGPHLALLVQGDDEMGALSQILAKLYEADVNMYSSSGVTDGRGNFGCVIYVRADEFERAATALGL